MTKEEFEEIIKPLWLIDNKTHREFLMQSIKGNFNRWNESKVKNLSSNTVLSNSVCACPTCKSVDIETSFCNDEWHGK